MAIKSFTIYDAILHVISLITFILDVGTDVLVVVHLLSIGQYTLGCISLGFVLAPALLMLVFSMKWHVDDGSLTCPQIIPHLLFISPVVRYMNVIRLGLRARATGSPRDLEQVVNQQRDASILRLVEAFLESAPQVCLQLYILLFTAETNIYSALSAATSLLSLGWAICAYSDSNRVAQEALYQRRWLGVIAHTLWQIFMVASRITAIVLFVDALGYWIFLFLGIHMGLMILWVMIMGTDFAKGLCVQGIFCGVAGFIYTFTFLNLNEGHTRLRISIFYCLMLVENATLSGVWLAQKSAEAPHNLTIAMVVIVYAGFALGSVFMLLYYCCCHPSRPMFLRSDEAKEEVSPVPNCFDRAVGTRSSMALSPSDQLAVMDDTMVEVCTERTLVSVLTKTGTKDRHSRAKSPQRRSGRDLNRTWREGMKVSHSSSESSMDMAATEGRSEGQLVNRNPETGSRLREEDGSEDDECDAGGEGGFASGPMPKHMSSYGRATPPPPLPPRPPGETMQQLPSDQSSQASSMCTIRTDMRPESLSPLSASQIWGESEANLQTEGHRESGSDQRGDFPSSPSSPEYVSMAMPESPSFYLEPQATSTEHVTIVWLAPEDVSKSSSLNRGSRSTSQNVGSRSISQNMGHSSSRSFDRTHNDRYEIFSGEDEDPQSSYLANVHLSTHSGQRRTPNEPPHDLPQEERVPASADNANAQQSFNSSGSEKRSGNTSSSTGQSGDSRSPPRMAGGEGMCSAVQSPYNATPSDMSGTEKSSSSGHNNADQSFSPRSLVASHDNPREARCSWPGFSDTSGLEDMRNNTLPNVLESTAEGLDAEDETLVGDPQMSSSFSQSHFMKCRRDGFDRETMAGIFSPASMISHNDADLNSDSSLQLSQLHSGEACSDDFCLTPNSAEDVLNEDMANNPSADSPPLEMNPPIQPEYSPFARSRRIPSLRDSRNAGIGLARSRRDAEDDSRGQPQRRSQEAGSQTAQSSMSNPDRRRPPTGEGPPPPPKGSQALRPYNPRNRMNRPPQEDVAGARGQPQMPPFCMVVREEKQSITAGQQLTHVVSSRSICSHRGEISVTSSTSASSSGMSHFSCIAHFGSSGNSSYRDDSNLQGGSDANSPQSSQATPPSQQQQQHLVRNEACQTSARDLHQGDRNAGLAGGSHGQSSYAQGEGHACRNCGCQGSCSDVPLWNVPPGHLDYLDLPPTPGMPFIPSMQPMGHYPPMLYIPIPLHQLLPPSGLSQQQLLGMLQGQGNQWRPQDYPAAHGPPHWDHRHEPPVDYNETPRRMFRDRVRSLSSPDMHHSPRQEEYYDRGGRAPGGGYRYHAEDSRHPYPATPRPARRSGEPMRRSTPREYDEELDRRYASQSYPYRSHTSRRGRPSLDEEQLAMLEMDRDSSQPDGTEDGSQSSDPQDDRGNRPYPRVKGRREQRGSKMDILQPRHFEDNLDNTVIDMREHRGGRSRKESDPSNSSAQSGREPKPGRVEGRRGMGLAEISRNCKKHDNSVEALLPDDPNNSYGSRRGSGKSTPVDNPNISRNSTSSGPKPGRPDENRRNRSSSSSKDTRRGNSEGSIVNEAQASSSQSPADDSSRQPFSSLENVNKASSSQKTPGNTGTERTVVGSSGSKSLKCFNRPKVSNNK